MPSAPPTGGGWTALVNPVPNGDAAGTMLLLSDGTVMAQGGGTTAAWYKLTADSTGGYVNGTWSQLASMNNARLYGASEVLPSGKVLFLGGEYSDAGSYTNTGEIYDPLADTWSYIASFPQTQFGDDPTELLPNGQILAGYIAGPETYLYDPPTDSWSQTATKLNNDRSDEESWLMLPDGSILSYDVFNSVDNGQNTAQRYVPSTGQWVAAGTLPVALTSSALKYEMGPALLLPDGRAFFIGGNGHTALYDPSTDSWSQGPDIPNGQHADDAPACMLVNGTVLLAADGAGGADASDPYAAPTNLYAYDPTTNTMSQVDSPTDLSNAPAYMDRMLALPNGQVLFTDGTGQLFVYSPPGSPAPAARPTITSINSNGDGSYVLTGTQLNGFSEGAAYGDDAEMSSNYPIIQVTDLAGNVSYARTFNWTSVGVDTGSAPIGVEFTLPVSVQPGAYYLTVSANGIASAPVLAVFTGSANDSVTLDVDTQGGVTGDLNGQPFDVAPGNVGGVDVVNTGGDDTDTVLATPLGVPLHIGGGGYDTITIGNAGSVQGIEGDVTVEDYTGYATINVDDSNDDTTRTVTLDTVALPDAVAGPFEGDSDLYGQLSGLAPAAVRYEHFDTSSITISGGTGGNTWNVLATGDSISQTTTIIMANSAGASVLDTMNVGKAGSVQGILGTLDMDDQPFDMVVNVDDSADGVPRTVSLDNGQLNNHALGVIVGLSPGTIGYGAPATTSATILTGSADGNVVNVYQTMAIQTNIIAAGNTTVNVGRAGRIDDFSGPLNVDGPDGAVNITVDDSANLTAQTVTLSTMGPNPADPEGSNDIWGQVNLGGGPLLQYEYRATGSLMLSLGTAASTVEVQGTSEVATTIAVGPANDRQTVFLDAGALTFNGSLQGAPYDNTVVVSTNSQGGVDLNTGQALFSGDPGLVSAVTLNTGFDAEYVDILTTPYGMPVNVVGGRPESVNLGNNGSVQGILGDVNVENPLWYSRLSIDDSSDTLARTVTLRTIGPNPTDSEARADAWDQVSGLTGHGTINYEDLDLQAVTIDGGLGGNTWNVLSTGVSTTIEANNPDPSVIDTVNVGDAGSVQGIEGWLSLVDNLGYIVLNVDDSADHSARAVTLTDNSDIGNFEFGQIIGLSPAMIAYQYEGTSNVTIAGGTAANTWNVPTTLVSTTVNAGIGKDTFNLGSTVGSTSVLTDLAGDLTINGGGGVNTINARDGGQTGGQAYVLSGNTLTGSDFSGAVSFSSAKLLLTLGRGDDTVTATAVPTGVTLDGGAGNNTLIGPNLSTTTTWTINKPDAGYLTAATRLAFSNVQKLVGGTGNDTFKFASLSAGLSGTLDGGSGTNKLDYTGYHASISVTLTTMSAGTASLITGGFSNIESLAGYASGAGSNTLNGPGTGSAQAYAWSVTAVNGGSLATVGTSPILKFTFAGIGNLLGGSAANTFKISNGKGIAGSIVGGSGTSNTLDYSSWASGVTVNLASGQATGIVGGVTGFNLLNGSKYADNLTGGSGIEIIRGNGGNDTITGGSGSDILIGGNTGTSTITSGNARSILIADKGTADVLSGDTAGDILIGGYTKYDASSAVNNAALLDVLAEWTSSDAYTTRIARIRAGVGSGRFNSTTVFNTSTGDVLNGAVNYPDDPDWFWAAKTSEIQDGDGGSEQVD